MMRAVVVALAFCLANVLADDEFVPGVWNVPVVPGKPDKRLIDYYVKRPTNPPPEGGPIFYGIGGRVSVEEIKDQYNLFDFVHNDFFNATVIYVEQRFFGRSKVGRIEKVEDLSSLTLDNVVNDHVVLIQKFAADYNTQNILVFGGGHGGTIAGYVANKFATDKDLKAKYNVLGWSSSPPTKYLRHVAPEDGKLHDIGKQILDLMKSDADSGQTCVDADALKLPYVFQAIKRWFGNAAGATTGYSIAQALKLDPIPAIKVLTTDPLTDDQKELVAYLRNQIIGFAFEPPFVGTDDTKQPRKLAKLCQIVKPLTGAADSTDVTADVVNRILDLISNAPAGTTRKVQWKVSDDGTGRLNQDLVAATYQDCTDYKIFYCAESANPDDNKGDPLAASQYNLFYTAASTGGCTKLDEYNAGLKAECEGYFGSGFDTTKDLSKETYPAVLTTQVVTTINSKSIFGKSGTFADGTDKNVPNYGFFYYLDGSTDNWEFQTPRSCDGKMVGDVRYSILRAFGCLGNFVQNTDGKTDICPKDKLFDPADADKTDVSGVCTVNKSNKFPFSQTPLGFLPPYHSTVAPTIITTTVTVPTVVSTLSTQAPTTSDGNNFLPSAIILASSAMLLFTTL